MTSKDRRAIAQHAAQMAAMKSRTQINTHKIVIGLDGHVDDSLRDFLFIPFADATAGRILQAMHRFEKDGEHLVSPSDSEPKMRYPHKTPWSIGEKNPHGLLNAEGKIIAMFTEKFDAAWVKDLANEKHARPQTPFICMGCAGTGFTHSTSIPERCVIGTSHFPSGASAKQYDRDAVLKWVAESSFSVGWVELCSRCGGDGEDPTGKDFSVNG